MATTSESVKIEYLGLTPRELLDEPPDRLLGVNAAAATVLQTLNIHSVFDLATSRVFANANALVEAATSPTNYLARYGMPPSDLVDQSVKNVPVRELQIQGIEKLLDISDEQALQVKSTLFLITIRELALWPPYRAARAILNAEFFPEVVPGFDPEAPTDLLPRSGEYPTERVFFDTLVIGDDIDSTSMEVIEKGINVQDTTQLQEFTKPTIGVLLTFSQSWFTLGVALGQLLHSAALAPGESTRIAVYDWSRRTRGVRTEDVTESEELSNVTHHGRAVSEVSHGVAKEAQSGFSATNSVATATQRGGGFVQSLFGGSRATATSTTNAMSFSSSWGRREVAASMAQKIMDSTQQYANAVRNRRASVVQEISQEEHESVSTRVITNYNHMHALSIQYYEVVQIYRTAVQLADAQRCLFVPFKLIDFIKTENNTSSIQPEVVNRYRELLASAALTEAVRDWLSGQPELIEVIPNPPAALTDWNLDSIKRASRVLGMSVLRTDRDSLSLSESIRLVELSCSIPLNEIRIHRSSGEPLTYSESEVTLSQPVNGSILESIEVIPERGFAGEDTEAKGFMSLTFETITGVRFSLEVPIKLIDNGGRQTVIRVTGQSQNLSATTSPELYQHLQDNRLYYSQVIFRSLDASTMTLLLAPYMYEIDGKAKPLIQLIDSLPIAISGNYLVFRMPGEIKENEAPTVAKQLPLKPVLTDWGTWLSEHGIVDKETKQLVRSVKEEIIPLPSGGVFAEAVLGRFNSAEKLDDTRFWNWLDSPIPIQPSEIAAIQMGSRAQPENLEAGPFSSPLVSIVSPTALPNPTGLSATLNTLANGSMFRDMSGLAATIELAQLALQEASAGATAAGNRDIEVARVALDAVKAIATKGASTAFSGSGSTLSEQGARMNHGRRLDQQAQSSGNGFVPSLGDEDSALAGHTGAGPARGNDADPHQYEKEAFRAALHGPLGESQGSFIRTILQGPSPFSGGSTPPSKDWDAVKSRVVRITEDEYSRWGGGQKPRQKKEVDPNMTETLQGYWAAVGLYPSTKDVRNPKWQESHPWSAAFISWVMQSAGANPEFEGSSMHSVYMATAKKNRVFGDTTNPIWAFRITELALEPGDIICKARAGSGATYDNLDDGVRRKTHCDIVVATSKGEVQVIGGNTDDQKSGVGENTVGKKTLPLTDDGKLQLTGAAGDYFAVLRIQTSPESDEFD